MFCLNRPAVRTLRLVFSLLFLGLSWGSVQGEEPPADWSPVKIPETWKKPPAGIDNTSWYRGFVKAPEEWRDQDLEIFVEPFDAANEVYFNGTKLGGAGEFPPFFRSGLGGKDRFFVPASEIRFDRPNVLAIRVYNLEGRTGFNVAAPIVFGGKSAIRMIGEWQYRPGDNASWAKYESAAPPEGFPLFDKLENAEEVTASLKKIDDAGPQSPAESLKQFTAPEDVELEVALSEPLVQQPLSIKFDPRGRLWVNQFIQYPDPAGLKMVSRDKFLRSVYDKVPPPPPNHFPGLDRISYHEDTDGDGKFDKHGVFVEGLSLSSSFAFDQEGLWVLQPPYLLFYPDRNHDDVPDGSPEVHLQGFGIEDSHSIANSLRWGPDGWLYGAQGSTVTGDIRPPGGTAPGIKSLGQCIWRYHPQTRRYEIFAEGGGNSFGLEIDTQGRTFSGHNGDKTRGFHFVQGGYYQKGFEKHGSLSNPYAFGYFGYIAHPNVPRFTHSFIIYDAPSGPPGSLALPEKYDGHLFAINPLQGTVIRSLVSPDRSSVKTEDVDILVASKDTWFRPVDIQLGPDGAIYVCDMYEQRIDHASHYQGRIDRERGRILRVKGKGTSPALAVNLENASSSELVGHLSNPNRTIRQNALLALAWRQDPGLIPEYRKQLASRTDDAVVNQLWGLNLQGGLSEELAATLLSHPNSLVREWTIRLLGDRNSISEGLRSVLLNLARHEENSRVRSQLASTLRRLPGNESLPILSAMLEKNSDQEDIHIPLLIWWGFESKAETDRAAVLAVFSNPDVWKLSLARDFLLERLMRRYASAGTQTDLQACAKLLNSAPDADAAKILLAGFEKAFEGRSLAGLPDELVAAIAKVGGGSTALRLRQGDPEALQESLKVIADEQAKRADRLKYLQIIAEIHPDAAQDILLSLVTSTKDPELRGGALGALQSYDSPKIGSTVVEGLSSFDESSRYVALNLLASRKFWARDLLTAVDQGKADPKSIPVEVVQRMLFQKDDQNAQLIEKHFGSVQGATTAEMQAQVESLKQVLSVGTGNPYNGRKLFMGVCGKCHLLFNEGGRIGPDLTGYKRDDLHTMLVNVINPSAQIREGFENYVLITTDGRALTGFIADQDARVVVLKGADGQTTIVPRVEIEELAASPKSLMPEGALKDFQDQQIRDLFAYLRATQPLP